MIQAGKLGNHIICHIIRFFFPFSPVGLIGIHSDLSQTSIRSILFHGKFIKTDSQRYHNNNGSGTN